MQRPAQLASYQGRKNTNVSPPEIIEKANFGHRQGGHIGCAAVLHNEPTFEYQIEENQLIGWNL